MTIASDKDPLLATGEGQGAVEEPEEEEVESTEAVEEAVEQVEETETTEGEVGEEESVEQDDGDWLEFVQSGEAKKLNLKDPEHRVRVKTALEKEGLEVTTQRAVEAAKQAKAEAEALRVKLREREVQDEIRKPLEPYIKLVEDPNVRARLQAQVRGLPTVNYNPEVARVAMENAELRRRTAIADDQQALADASQLVVERYKLSPQEMQACVDYLNENKMGWQDGIPKRQQIENVVSLVGLARNALIGQGKLPNPEVLKLQAEKAKTEERLEKAKKRAKARPASAGGGAIASKAGSGQPDLSNASTADLVAYYKHLTGAK